MSFVVSLGACEFDLVWSSLSSWLGKKTAVSFSLSLSWWLTEKELQNYRKITEISASLAFLALPMEQR
jgi:hypothetical protein